MEKSFAMNGGDGPNSYFRNSKPQERRMKKTMVLVRSSIEEFLELKKDSKVFTIADLGCSVGPNTFTCVNNIIEAVQNKYRIQGNDLEVPEFHVFFNDRIANDFNTLFKTLPLDRQYMAAGVPGSFHGRVFPKSSMNLMHSSIALHLLTSVPEEVTKEDSPLWNKGRVTYAWSSNQIGEAFRAQFIKDMEAFFRARSEELAPGGLLLIIMACRPEGTLPSESTNPHLCGLLGDALVDMVKEGLTSESLVNSFNLPFFFPTASEINQVVSSNKNLRTEKFEVIPHDTPNIGTPEDAQRYSVHIRAVFEHILHKHFGPDIMDELFDRYSNKLETFSKTPEIVKVRNLDRTLFMLVKRTDSS